MLKNYVEAVKRLGTDKDGVVSFEYVLVAACIIGAVPLVFSNTGAGGIGTILTNALTAIGTAITGVL